MRTLDSNLLAEQIKMVLEPVIKITLTHGATEYVLEEDRLKKLTHLEEPWRANAKEVELDNSDGYFTDKDLKGYKAVISYGLNTDAGKKYSDTAPMWVVWQQLNSSQGRLTCLLTMLGIPDLMDDDEASASYLPEETDTKTVKTLITEIITKSLACYSHCQAYEVVWESGYDTLADTYMPKDSFRIYIGGSRLAAIKRLMEYTKNVLRFENDGKLHILLPTTTGSVYDYEYSLESGHVFWSKAYRKTLVLPNRIVIKSQKDDVPQYSGEATSPVSYALLPRTAYYQTRLQSHDEAKDIAEAIIFNLELNAEQGSAAVPINCGAELFDYIKVTDERESDYRIGSIGSLTRTYDADKVDGREKWRMTFSLGDPPVVQYIKELYQSIKKEAEKGSLKGVFDKLYAKDAYIENLSIDQINAIWLDPDSNIDASKITSDFLDNLPDGETYVKYRAMDLTASGLAFVEQELYTLRLPGEEAKKVWKSTTAQTTPATGDLWIDTNYTPNRVKRWDGSQWQELPAEDIEDLKRGVYIREVKSSSLTAEGLVFLKELDTSGDYGLVLATGIYAGQIKLSAALDDATHRLTSDSEKSAWDAKPDDMDEIDIGVTFSKPLKDQITVGGYLKLNANTYKDGEWYNESGVIIDATSGITIKGVNMAFKTQDIYGNTQCYMGSDGKIYAGAGAVKLSYTGIEITGKYLTLKYAGAGKGYISGDSSGLLIDGLMRIWLAPYGSTDRVYIRAATASPGGKLDCADTRGLRIPSKSNITSPEERDFGHRYYGQAWLSVYSAGAWRDNA